MVVIFMYQITVGPKIYKTKLKLIKTHTLMCSHGMQLVEFHCSYFKSLGLLAETQIQGHRIIIRQQLTGT